MELWTPAPAVVFRVRVRVVFVLVRSGFCFGFWRRSLWWALAFVFPFRVSPVVRRSYYRTPTTIPGSFVIYFRVLHSCDPSLVRVTDDEGRTVSVGHGFVLRPT